MKHCFACGRITTGEPLYCNFCGKSYDVKLCPRKHVNPRIAEICSKCGSRELSTPQPKVSPVWHLLGFLARVTVAVLIAYVFLTFVSELFAMPETRDALVVLVLLLLVLWFLWGMLPLWFRRLIRWSWKKGRGRSDER
jgi:RNA polymerase subunit RPABC4/transcription elongation factor Spt4